MPTLSEATRKFPEIKSGQLVCIQWLLLAMLFMLSACSSDEGTPEQQINAYIEQAIQAAETRDHDALGDLIHKQYRGEQIINRAQAIGTARAYFFRHKHIHLLSKIERIEFLKEDKAFVVVYIAMAGQVISDINALASLRARFYRFELELENDGQWLLTRARWNHASLNDML